MLALLLEARHDDVPLHERRGNCLAELGLVVRSSRFGPGQSSRLPASYLYGTIDTVRVTRVL